MTSSSAARVEAAWTELHDALAALRPMDYHHIDGLTVEEITRAESLFFASQGLERDASRRRIDALSFLTRYAPGAPSVEAAIDRLSPELIAAFNRLVDEE